MAAATAAAFSVLPAEVLFCVAQKLPVLERRHLPAVCQRLRALSRSECFWSHGDDSSVRLVYSSTDRLRVLVKFLSSLEGPITWRSLELEIKCCVPELADYLLSLGVSLPWLTSFQVDGVCPGDSTPGGLAVSPWLSSFVKLTRLSITRVPVLFQGRFPLAATARLTELTLCRTGVCRTSLLQQLSAMCTLTLDSVYCEGPIVPVSVSTLTSLRSLTLATKSDESVIVPLRSNLPSSLTAQTLQNPHTLVEYGPVDVAFDTLPRLRHLELTLHAHFSPHTDWYQCLRHLTCLRLNAHDGEPQPAIAVLSRLTALRSLTVRYPRPVSLDLTLPPNLVSLALWGRCDYLLELETEPQGMCSIADIRRSAPQLSIVVLIHVYLRVSHDDLKHLMLSSDIRIDGPVKYFTYM